jgi:hypothetical protein
MSADGSSVRHATRPASRKSIVHQKNGAMIPMVTSGASGVTYGADQSSDHNCSPAKVTGQSNLHRARRTRNPAWLSLRDLLPGIAGISSSIRSGA